MAEQEAWKWQETGTAWKGVGIYHVTLVVPSRESLLGRLVIPENDPKQAVVERTEMGKEIVYLIGTIPQHHPQIRLIQYCLMPDHAHFILYVTESMPVSIKAVVRGFWQSTKQAGREYISSISPNDIRVGSAERASFISGKCHLPSPFWIKIYTFPSPKICIYQKKVVPLHPISINQLTLNK